MLAEMGNYSLILALGLSLLLIYVTARFTYIDLLGQNKVELMLALGVKAKALVIGMFFFISFSFCSLTMLFVQNDFSVLYVANNSQHTLPLIYKLAAVWGAHEGSMLMWVLILSGWTLTIAYSKQVGERLQITVLLVLAFINTLFMSFVLVSSNPFIRLFPAPTLGADLNPLLQDLSLTIHPPMLYLGYIGLAIPFAFATAALLRNELDTVWARMVTPWILAAFSFLTLGVVLGSFWAYYELGWGGYWFWDPVENASLIPLLVVGGLLHTTIATRKHGGLLAWSLLLSILAFAFSLVGAFIVRSGVLSSVHAFAKSEERGIWLLSMLAILILPVVSLFIWRIFLSKIHNGSIKTVFKEEEKKVLVVKENMFFACGILLLLAAVAVLLGTIYPLLWDDTATIGVAYFERVFAPIMAIVLILLPLGKFIPWQGTRLSVLKPLRLGIMLWLLITLLLIYYQFNWGFILGVSIALWVIILTLQTLIDRIKLTLSLKLIPLSFYGMFCAHLGIGICLLGITCLRSLEQDLIVEMQPGAAIALGNYIFTLQQLTYMQGANYTAVKGHFAITDKETKHLLVVMYPEKRYFAARQVSTTETAIAAFFLEDLYIALGDKLQDNTNTWLCHIYVKPGVRWIWGGGILIALGGFMAAISRYRKLN